jgi:molybdenum cofactor cytidylyltransferase
VPVAASEGAFVAHAIKSDGLSLKKGDLVRAADIEALQARGITEITVARLEDGDVDENAAAACLAERLAGANLRREKAFTGRSNLFAECSGVLVADTAAIDRLNCVDESMTIATLMPLRRVVEGEMVATVKIIPFAVSAEALARGLEALGAGALAIAPFQPLRVGVVSTLLPGLRATTVTKTLRILEDRLAWAQASIAREERVAHETEALAAAIGRVEPACDLVVVFGASAITDRRDVIPAAIEKAGGRVEHFGMPVDPGNLLLIGKLPTAAGDKPVLGAPGCARSPKENGFDFVLHRLLAGLDVTGDDIRRMGVGGLLMEIVSRPQPRAGADA